MAEGCRIDRPPDRLISKAWPAWLFALALVAVPGGRIAAQERAESYGQVTFGGLPIPGATVTASQGDRRVVVATDPQGVYHFTDLPDGLWTMRVEMVGFAVATRDVAMGPGTQPTVWELTLLPFEEIARGLPASPPRAASASTAQVAPRTRAEGRKGGGLANRPDVQRAAVSAAPPPAANGGGASALPADEPAGGSSAAADGFLINGSVNNGATSLFAQPSAFGNNRRRPGSLYNFGFGLTGGSSAFDARPFSFTADPAPKPSYGDVHVVGIFGGPIKVPRLRNALNVFIGAQRADDHNATTQSAVMPTALERSGDFSQSTDAFGRPVHIVDPRTGQPFAGGVIPSSRLSPQAASLLQYYPQPNAAGRFNFQSPVLTATRQDNLQSRISEAVTPRNQVFATLAYQRTETNTHTLFGFDDTSTASTVDAAINWTHRLTQFFSVRPRYQYTRTLAAATPYFADRTNVSAEAGIVGNDQEPQNWGPPNVIFSNGVASLSDALPAFTRTATHTAAAEAYWSRGRHNVTFGGDLRRQQIAIDSQQNPRGTYAFTGFATGSALADFLLGVPGTSSIAFGNADKRLGAWSGDAYVTDDLRVGPSLTVNLGVRWEYEGPLREDRGRLVNLDVAPDFSAVAPVVASEPLGALTRTTYPDTLLWPDRRGVQPRLALAWRPVPGSSLIVRAGYGIYRNVGVYQSIATALAQQPPLSNTFSVPNTIASPFTIANGFIVPASTAQNTFAVDPDFRVSSAQNWQVSVQRDLPASLTITASYLGAKGSHLMQEFLPNTYPEGASDPCLSCPSGFVYLTSNGTSFKQAGQVQLRRRLRNGLTASVQYTLSKATDNAAAFTTAALGSGATPVVAQNWLDLEAERAPSAFDQRHLVAVQLQYTTGMGVHGGALLEGLKGSLLKGWTITSQLTTGSGLPVTPQYLAPVAGTGVTGTLRPDLTGVPADATPAGYYLNPASYTSPPPGRWGSAGRNSARGPAQFALNAGISRNFPWGARMHADWSVEATNVLNRVTYAMVDTVVGSPQFGLPTIANPMRKIQTSLRVRY